MSTNTDPICPCCGKAIYLHHATGFIRHEPLTSRPTERYMMTELPDYNEDGTANPKGDASYWRDRAEKAEAMVRKVIQLTSRFAYDDMVQINYEDDCQNYYRLIGEWKSPDER